MDNPQEKSKNLFLSKLPHIGMRKVKSLVAIVIGFVVWQIIRIFFPGLEVHPIYMYLYGVIEIRDTSEKTVNFGKRRIKATFVAIAVGIPVLLITNFIKSYIDNETLFILFEVAVVLLGVLLSLIAAEKAGCDNFCGIAAIIFIILAVSYADGGVLVYACLRASQTIMAVFIAWLLNVKLFPYPRVSND